MNGNPPADRSNGYEGIAHEYTALRNSAAVGEGIVREWIGTLPRGSDVLDLGCGHGVPISAAIAAEGMNLYGVDASPTLLAAFRSRFPNAHAQCSSVEESDFFGRSFDAVIGWGLLFLLAPVAQATLIGKVANALRPDGHFLFTSPRQACAWMDVLTGKPSISLGAAEYTRLLDEAGLELVVECEDEGGNHYYSSRKRAT